MKNQRQRVLDYLKRHGKIDDTQARDELGIRRLAARVHELRKAGHSIKRKMIKAKNRFDEPVEYAQYHYIPPEPEQGELLPPKPQRNKAFSL